MGGSRVRGRSGLRRGVSVRRKKVILREAAGSQEECWDRTSGHWTGKYGREEPRILPGGPPVVSESFRPRLFRDGPLLSSCTTGEESVGTSSRDLSGETLTVEGSTCLGL